MKLSMIHRLASRATERGQVVVMMALMLPVILGFGSVVVSIGNWYVHKKHLQTLADAGAFASGLAFTGCYQDPGQTNPLIAQAALEYAGDPSRDPLTRNSQLEEPADAHVVLNSTQYWAGNPYPADNTLGLPCDTKFLDVKATEDKVPLLFRWLPASPSPKAKARIEIRKTLGITGLLPLAVPEVEPARVAALIVNEDVAASSAASIVTGGAVFLNNNMPAPPPDLSAWDVWHGDLAGVNLNGNENFGVVILTSRDPAVSLSGSLQTVCNQNPVQVTCYRKPWSSTGGLSFIHAYSDSTPGGINPPAIRQVELFGGDPTDLSAPYFNLNGGSGIAIQAKIDFGVIGKPTAPDRPCATVTGPGGAMSWSAGGIGGALGTWTGSFTPAAGSGRNVINLSWVTDRAGPCSGPNWSGSFPRVAAPYVSDTYSGPVQYLWVGNNSAPGSPANSINGTSSASLHVTVGLLPPLIDANVLDPPIRLRFGSPSGSQNQALDCDKNINFRDEILNGCLNPYRENMRNGVCTGYGPGNLPVPTVGPFPGDDCIIVETGDKTGQIRSAIEERWGYNGGPTCKTLNNWPTAIGDPLPNPLTDKRFVTLFIADENTFGASGNDIYPIRRFAGFYLTAADGLGCPGDDPAVPGAKNVWGHFMSYVVPNPNATPTDELCAFTDAGTCIAILVE